MLNCERQASTVRDNQYSQNGKCLRSDVLAMNNIKDRLEGSLAVINIKF